MVVSGSVLGGVELPLPLMRSSFKQTITSEILGIYDVDAVAAAGGTGAESGRAGNVCP